MSGNSELLAAFDSLANSIVQVRVGNSIKQAQARVDEINADHSKNEFERIKAQQAVAQQVGGNILAMSGDSVRAQAAAASLAPNIPSDAFAQLEATGKGTIVEARKQVAEDAQKRAMELEKLKGQLKLQEIKLQNEGKLDVKNVSGAAKPVPNQVTSQLSGLMDMKSRLQDLKDNFAEKGSQIGPLDQYRPNLLTPAADVAYKADVKQFFNDYRRVITGAAASIPELKSLLPAVPNESDLDSDFLAKIDAQIKGIDRGVGNRLKLMKAQGRDTSDLEEMFNIPSTQTAPAPDATPGKVNANIQAPAGGGLSKYIKLAP